MRRGTLFYKRELAKVAESERASSARKTPAEFPTRFPSLLARRSATRRPFTSRRHSRPHHHPLRALRKKADGQPKKKRIGNNPAMNRSNLPRHPDGRAENASSSLPLSRERGNGHRVYRGKPLDNIQGRTLREAGPQPERTLNMVIEGKSPVGCGAPL